MERTQYENFEERIRKNIAKNLRELLTKRNMTQKALSDLTKIPTSTLSDYLNAKSLAVPGNIQKMADALNVQKSDIDPSFGNVVYESVGEMVSLPIVGKISCGNGVIAFEEVVGYESVPREWIKGGEHFFLEAKGDSMTGARIYEDDLLLIRKQEEVENGEIAAVLIDDEAVLKRVYRNGDQLILQSENPKYGPILAPPEDVKILGKLKMNVIKY